jgi:hypothetical protein
MRSLQLCSWSRNLSYLMTTNGFFFLNHVYKEPTIGPSKPVESSSRFCKCSENLSETCVTCYETFNVSWSVRASSYIPISRPTDATCDRYLFSICMCIILHVSIVKRSSSGVPHCTYSLQFLCLCPSAALSCKKFLTYSAADRHKHRNWRLYVR